MQLRRIILTSSMAAALLLPSIAEAKSTTTTTVPACQRLPKAGGIYKNCNWSGLTLPGNNLTSTNLTGTNLSNADLSSAILIGTATALADNPNLIPRDIKTTRETNPVRIVMGLREIPSDFNLHNDAAETVFLRSHDFSELRKLCAERDFNQVFVESGSELGTALLKAGLIDELIIFQAASLLGSGLSFIGDLGATNIREKTDFLIRDFAQFGNDLKITLTKETGI